MLRLASPRLQVLLALVLLVCLFTASLGGVAAQTTRPGSSPDTQLLAAKTQKPAKTPNPAKTKKLKRTKTPSPTVTLTEQAQPSETPTATPDGVDNPTPSETPDELGTPTPTSSVIGKTIPAPKQTRQAQKTAVRQQTRRARKTARAKQTRRAKRRATRAAGTPTATATPPADQEEIVIEPATGGRFAPEKGNIVLQVPPDALRRTARFIFTRQLASPHGDGFNGQTVFNQFSLTAHPAANPNRLMRKFEKDLTLKVRYKRKLLGSLKPQNLMVVYWDTKIGVWRPLDTWLNRKTKRLQVVINHFTDFGLVNAPEVSNFVPGMAGFQTDLFSGASSYSFPIQVPAGQGGLAPRLSLSYSSTGIDPVNSNMTVSHVGLGWSLDTGYIARVTTNRFAISLNGAGYDLVLGADGKYHTAKEQYWRIERSGETDVEPSGDTWTVTTNDGTRYIFGQEPNALSLDLRKNLGTGHYDGGYYQYWLYQVIDTHGNMLQYTYTHDAIECNQVIVDRAVYPDRIEYNADGAGGYRTRISFA